MPVVSSFACTLSRPSASTWKRHLEARHAGGHRRDALEREARQAAVVGDHLALALHDVDLEAGLACRPGSCTSRVAAHGMVELRGRILSTTPPPTSMPSDSGMTSSRSTSSRRALARRGGRPAPPRRARRPGRGRCRRAAPCSKSSATYARTQGTRVAPPTRMTPSSSAGLRPASLSARRHATPVRSSSGRDERLEARARDRDCASCAGHLGVDRVVRRERVLGLARLVEHEAHELRRLPRLVEAELREELVRRCARSMSSPPSALSPPVDLTWKTPSSSRRIVTSNVPPPRS